MRRVLGASVGKGGTGERPRDGRATLCLRLSVMIRPCCGAKRLGV